MLVVAILTSTEGETSTTYDLIYKRISLRSLGSIVLPVMYLESKIFYVILKAREF